MKTTTYMKIFETEDEAIERATMKNRAYRAAGNFKDVLAVVEGPVDDWYVLDIRTAIEHGQGYFVPG